MIHISKSHKRFSERLRNSRVLTHPEEFLGPNYKAILDFWMILDELTQDQRKTINGRCLAFRNKNRSEWVKATDLSIDASEEVVGYDYAYHAGWAACDVTNSAAVARSTRELIGIHKILEDRQQPLTFFPMFLEVL